MKMIKQPTIPPMPKQPTFDARDTQYNLPIGKDLISRAEAQTELQLSARRYTVAHEAHGEGRVVWSEDLISVSDAMNVLRKLPPAQPELIEKIAYIRGFERGRTQGMIDSQGGKKYS